MSVINKMLKDLESRQQDHQISNLEAVAPTAHHTPSTPIWRWLALILVLGAVGAGVYLWLAASEQSITKPSTTEPSTTEQIAPVSEAADRVAGHIQQVESSLQAIADKSDAEPLSESTTAEAEPSVLVEQEPVENNEPVLVQTKAEVPQVAEPSVSKVAEAKLGVPEPETTAVTLARESAKAKITEAEVANKPMKPQPSATKNSGQMAITPVPMTAEELGEKRLELALKAQQSGDFAKAQSEFLAALEYAPALHSAREQLAALQYGEGQLRQAAQTLEQGVSAFPDYQNYRLLLARVYQAGGETQQAFDQLAVMTASGQQAIEKWALLGDLAQSLNRFDKAEQAYSQLLAMQPQQGRWMMAKAFVVDSQGRFSDAADYYRQALAMSGLSDDAVAFIQQRLGQLGAVK